MAETTWPATERFVRGAGAYVGDLDLPDVLAAAFVRSPHAHARVAGIDATAARALPGIVAILTADDLAAAGIGEINAAPNARNPDGSPPAATPRLALAAGTVRHVGEPVALVLAETEAAALDAAEAVAVEYEALPAVTAADAALARGAPQLWDGAPGNVALRHRHGDAAGVDAALAAAAHRVRVPLVVSRVAAQPMEPRAVAAIPDGDRLTVQASSQNPHQLKTSLARILGIPPEAVRVVAPDVGGSFGMKAGAYPEDVAVAAAARLTGRPVRWLSTRSEALLADEQARDVRLDCELGLDADGRFLAFRVDAVVGVGAWLSQRSVSFLFNLGGIAGVYRTPLIAADVTFALANVAPLGPYRGAGRPEATYAIERSIDAAARATGIDAAELRRRNLIDAGAMPFATPFTFRYDCGDFATVMDLAVRRGDVAGFPARRAAAAARGRLRGLGLSNPIEVAAGPFGSPGKDCAALAIAADGSVTLTAGVMSVGQGLERTLTDLVAARLDIPAAAIAYRQGDTDGLAFGKGSGGSAAIALGGSAVARAGDALVAEAARRAAVLLGVAPDAVGWRDGRFRAEGSNRTLSLAEVAAGSGGFAAEAEFQAAEVCYPNGCHLCEVEIDPETGRVSVESYVAVEDIGTVLNPALAEAQMHGGIAQGIGQALSEALAFDPETGQLLTGSLMDYGLPRASDLPGFDCGFHPVPTATNPLGAKGVGEAGAVGSLAAVMNAVADALAEAGVAQIDMPATPARVWAALQAAKARTSHRPPAG